MLVAERLQDDLYDNDYVRARAPDMMIAWVMIND